MIITSPVTGFLIFSAITLPKTLSERLTKIFPPSIISVNVIEGDVRQLHISQNNKGSLFQVASQFNLLEMVSPNISPEDGVTRYQNDRTQGPTCAISCGAATIFRNYFIPIQNNFGQTSLRQVNGIFDIGKHLSKELNLQISDLWKMKNGYALCTQKGLIAISDYFKSINEDRLNKVRGLLKVGIHFDILYVRISSTIRGSKPLFTHCFDCSCIEIKHLSNFRAGAFFVMVFFLEYNME